MQIKIKRVDASLPLPVYHTKGSVAFDIYSRVDEEINPNEIKLIPTNIIVETPPGYMLLLASRSSTPVKKGLILSNGIGVVDNDYCGENDEIKLSFFNIKKESVKIEKGERLAQGIFIKVEQAKWNEVEKIKNDDRGGYGSTGTHIEVKSP